jgi:RNA polymerase sigma factor (sigma-70 family)
MLGSPSEAEDAVQHAFMVAYRELDGGVTPAYPRAWLYTIARNRCLTLMRDRREVAATVGEPSTVGLAEEVERRSDLRELLRSMRRLPEEQRTALALFEMGGLSQTEIAQAMDCSPGRVKALVFQARTNLIHARAAAGATCDSVRAQLATLRGGRLNTRELRTHVRDCEGCAEFALAVREQRRRLAIVLPVLPLMAAMKAPVVTGVAAGGGAAVSGAGGAVLGSVGRKLAWLRPRPSVLAATAAGTGVVAAAAVAAVALGPGDDPPRRDSAARPAAVAPAARGPAATAAPIAKPTPRAKPARSAKKKAKKAKKPATAPARTPAPVAELQPVDAAATTPAPQPAPAAPVASAPPPAAPSPPAAAEPPGQDFDLSGPGPPAGAPQTPASEPEPPAEAP